MNILLQMRTGRPKGSALLRLNAYFSNLYLQKDGKYILNQIKLQYQVMKTNKSKKSKQANSVQAKEKRQEGSNQLSLDSFWEHYTKTTSQRTKIIDLFIIYLLVIIKTQVFYRLVVGDDFPRNAFVSGVFCPLGIIVLLVILRGEGLKFAQFGEFFIASIVLFVVGINFAG